MGENINTSVGAPLAVLEYNILRGEVLEPRLDARVVVRTYAKRRPP